MHVKTGRLTIFHLFHETQKLAALKILKQFSVAIVNGPLTVWVPKSRKGPIFNSFFSVMIFMQYLTINKELHQSHKFPRTLLMSTVTIDHWSAYMLNFMQVATSPSQL